MQPLEAKPPSSYPPVKPAGNVEKIEKKDETQTLIQHVKTALHDYQSFERGTKPLENKIEAISTKKKELITVYGKAVQKLLAKSLEVSDSDFALIKKFSRELHNSAFNQRLHEIEEARKTKTSLAMQDYLDVLEQVEQNNLSKAGLPWEQYALGSSPLHILSEKKALLNLLAQFHERFEKTSDARATLARLKKQLEAKIDSARETQAPEHSHLQMVVEAISRKEVLAGWSLERSKEIYDLINANIDALYGSDQAFKETNPLLFRILGKLEAYPSKITQEERMRLVSLLKAAENEQYLKSYLAEYPNHKKKAEELHIFIENQILEYKALMGFQGDAQASAALDKLIKMNASIPTQQPDWKQILKERRFTVSKIGEGAMGEVFRIRRVKPDGKSETYVVKTFKTNQPTYLDWLRAATGEKTARVQHENLIQTIGGFVDETGVQAIVMPYFENGSELLSYIEPPKFDPHHPSLSFEEATELTEQLIEAVKALHDHNILHHDIKDSNIMIRKEKDGKWKLVLVDAGLQEKLSNWKPKSKHGWGTPAYMPPEKLFKKVQGKGVDVYSLGVVIYRMYVNQFPLTSSISRPNLKAFNSEPLLQELLEAMLDPNPDTRYSIDAVKYAFHNFRRTRKI